MPSQSTSRQRRDGSRPVGNSSSATVNTASVGPAAHSPTQPIHRSAGSRSTKCEYVAYSSAATASVVPNEVPHRIQPIAFRGSRVTMSAPSGSNGVVATSRIS